MLSTSGRIIIPFKYDLIEQLAGEVFSVYLGDYRMEKAKCGVLNAMGFPIIPVENAGIEKFGTGYWVRKDNAKAAIFDSVGVQKTQYGCTRLPNYPIWDMCGEAFTVYNEGKRDFVQYEEIISNFMYRKGDKWGVINSKGEEATKPEYDSFQDADRNVIMVEKDKKWGIVDHNGKTLIPIIYDGIEPLPYSLFFRVMKNEKYGLVDQKGRLIAPMIFDNVNMDNLCGPGLIRVVKNGLTGLIDCAGKTLYPCKYAFINCDGDKISVSPVVE